MTPALRILLVDDEAPCRDALRIFLAGGCPEAQIVGEASSVGQAVALIPQTDPDLLLLDVEMTDGTGFDLLDRFPKPDFQVIFTTAHDDFAVRAFRYSAVDYLLKPVDPDELTAAVQRASQPGDAALRQLQLEQLRQQAASRSFERITLNTGDGLLFIRTAEIMHLEANGNYCFVFLENGERHLATQTLSSFDEILPSPPFFRAHQSHLVNTAFVRKLAKDDGDSLLMTSKAVVPLARRRKDVFIEMMKNNG